MHIEMTFVPHIGSDFLTATKSKQYVIKLLFDG